ncbi:hypothetical protein AAG906_018502 [Vitis piasezkii]
MSMGKHHKVPFQPSVTAYKQPLTLAHADLWGHAPCLSSAYFKYYICFVDHATRYLWLYTLPTKSETLPCFIKFKKLCLTSNGKIYITPHVSFDESQFPFIKSAASHFHSKLLSLRFHSSKANTSFFLKFEGGHSLYILIYVDDVLITSSSSTQVQDFITQLQTSFSLKDLGVPSYFLRLELTYTFQGVLLSQHKYIIDVLQKAHMDQTKPISTPMANGTSLSAYTGAVFSDLHRDRHILN